METPPVEFLIKALSYLIKYTKIVLKHILSIYRFRVFKTNEKTFPKKEERKGFDFNNISNYT